MLWNRIKREVRMQSLAEYDVLKKRLLSLSPTLKTKPTSKSVKFRKISKKILWIQSVLGLLGLLGGS